MSKKFKLVKFEVQDGEHTYYDYHLFFTSDFQKMKDEELIAHFYEGDKNIKLQLESEGVYWSYDMMRTIFVRQAFPVDLKTAQCLVNLKVINYVPQAQDVIFKKFNNIVQLKNVIKSKS
jgi:hypothetical protein